MPSSFVGRRIRSAAWWIAGAYAVFATLWIYYSDQALASLHWDPELLLRVSVYKGIGFVTVTAVLLFLMTRWTLGKIESSYEALKRNEVEIERQRRLYAALSQINQAIVWTRSRDDLFTRICQILIDFGGLRLATLVWPGPSNDTWSVAARSSSFEVIPEDPIDPLEKFASTKSCNNLQGDEVPADLREKSTGLGLQSWAAIPIRHRECAIGAIHVYAASADFFQEQEIALLEEAAMDIAFASENLDREEDLQRALAVAERERNFSDTMIDSMPGILYVYDETGRFIRWNQRFEEVSGYSNEEIARMHPLQFFSLKDRGTIETRMTEVFAEGESSVEAPFLSKSGDSSPHYFTGRKVEFDGRPCLVGVGIDISKRIEAETALKRSEERHRTTLDNILEGCQILDFEWTYLYLNRAASVQNRRANEELIGHRMPEIWPGIDETEIFAHSKRCLEERVPYHGETKLVFPDGSHGWFEVCVRPVSEGIVILSIDITERREAERALNQLNESLEAKVTERTTELRAALVEAEAADRLKSAFLATMSHELRTPLNSIIGFTGIVLQKLAGPLTEEQAKQLDMVRGSARHLLELINEILDLSKIEAGQLEIRCEEFDPRESVERVADTIRPLADKGGLSLAVSVVDGVAPRISGDNRRLEQILLNLLNNAVKFTETGGVSIEVAPATIDADGSGAPMEATRFRVADTGIGIRKSDLGQLFLPFRQLDSGITRVHEGTGLGLTICRRLTELLGGEIDVSSEQGEGSVFTVVIPNQPCDRS
ncbi:MAG: PAS domain S-box protein [Verrucomicrobiales bacterium]